MSKNKIGYEKQAKMVAKNMPQPFVFEYEGENIEVNPVLSPSEMANATKLVTALTVNTNDYYPEMEEFAIRFASMAALITNIRWDAEHIFERHYNQIMYTDLWDEFFDAMRVHECIDTLVSIRENATKKIRYELDMQHQNVADMLIIQVLTKVSSWLDKAKENLDAEDITELMKVAKDVRELGKDDKLVSKVLEYRIPEKEDTNDIGGSTTPVSDE